MSSTKLIVITGQNPAIQTQIQSILADQFALCSVPANDTDALLRLGKMAQAAIVVAGTESLNFLLSHYPLMERIPTSVVIDQPTPEALQQAYQAGAKQVLIWPASSAELQQALQHCLPKPSWNRWLLEWGKSVLQPVLSIRKDFSTPAAKRPDSSLVSPAFQARLFGGLSIYQQSSLLRVHTPKEQELLGYLLFHYPRRIKREKLCSALWPGIDAEAARNRLNVLIHRMRRGEGKDSSVADLVVFDHKQNAYCLHLPTHAVIDVHLYQELLIELKNQQHSEEITMQLCKKIVELNTGDFLEGVERSEWVDRQRYEIREQLQGIILRLSDYFLHRSLFVQAIHYCRKGVDLDPCLETVQQRLMLGLALNGDREAAIRAYHRFEQILAQELRIAPSTSSKEIIQLIRDVQFEQLRQYLPSITPKKN